MPGVLSARWAGVVRDDAANVRLVLEQLADVTDDRLGAAFVCSVALVGPDGNDLVAQTVEHTVEGRMAGRLVRTPVGDNGFGYDPIFVPDGYDRTSAELSSEEKDAISHRGQSLRKLAPLVASAVAGRR